MSDDHTVLCTAPLVVGDAVIYVVESTRVEFEWDRDLFVVFLILLLPPFVPS